MRGIAPVSTLATIGCSQRSVSMPGAFSVNPNGPRPDGFAKLAADLRCRGGCCSGDSAGPPMRPRQAELALPVLSSVLGSGRSTPRMTRNGCPREAVDMAAGGRWLACSLCPVEVSAGPAAVLSLPRQCCRCRWSGGAIQICTDNRTLHEPVPRQSASSHDACMLEFYPPARQAAWRLDCQCGEHGSCTGGTATAAAPQERLELPCWRSLRHIQR